MSPCDRATMKRSDSRSGDATHCTRAGGVADREGANVLKVRVVRMTAVPGTMVAQMMNSTWDAVITSADGAKILVLRRTKPPPGACPFLGCEVRHINGARRRADETG